MKNAGRDLAVAFCGAGHGPFIDKLVDEAWKVAETSKSLNEACQVIEKSIKRQYNAFGHIYQPGMCPEVQLIYGVKMQGKSRLFNATGPVVNEKHGYDAGGVGHYMAEFLAERMYNEYLNVHQCAILAAYILFQTKEHVDGCGGESHIAVLRNEAGSGLVDVNRINTLTELLKAADREASTLLLSPADLAMDEEEFKANLAATFELLQSYRDDYRDAVGRRNAMLSNAMASRVMGGPPPPKDFLGLPMLPDEDK
jgi:hypothetical protein